MPATPDTPTPLQRHLTLLLCTILHGFTHALGTLLVPLYLLVAKDLNLKGVRAVSLVVTIYSIVYCLGSYPAGVLSDRYNRKRLLGIGLIGNALAILAMGLTRRYEILVLLGVVAGLFGTLFHPAANALVPAHYPKNPGLAIGVLGAGSGLGFFAGPQFAGWRAEAAHWQFAHVAAWQRPCVEMGLLGILMGVAFLLLAREARTRGGKDAVLPARVATEELVFDYQPHVPPSRHLSRAMFRRVLAIAAVLGCRDFAGVAALSLASIYLQKAHAFSPKQAGFAVGAMMLLSILANPLSVLITPGKRRLPMLAAALVIGGLVLVAIPFLAVTAGILGFCVFQTFQLSSYAMSDAAMLERVSPEIRGRVVGVFLSAAGTFSALAPWVMGAWTDAMGAAAGRGVAYWPLFATLGAMMIFSSLATRLIPNLAREPIEASTEITRVMKAAPASA